MPMCKKEMTFERFIDVRALFTFRLGLFDARQPIEKVGDVGIQHMLFVSGARHRTLASFFNCVDYIFWHCVDTSVEKPLSAHRWFLLVAVLSNSLSIDSFYAERVLFLINTYTVERLYCDLNVPLYFKFVGSWYITVFK